MIPFGNSTTVNYFYQCSVGLALKSPYSSHIRGDSQFKTLYFIPGVRVYYSCRYLSAVTCNFRATPARHAAIYTCQAFPLGGWYLLPDYLSRSSSPPCRLSCSTVPLACALASVTHLEWGDGRLRLPADWSAVSLSNPLTRPTRRSSGKKSTSELLVFHVRCNSYFREYFANLCTGKILESFRLELSYIFSPKFFKLSFRFMDFFRLANGCDGTPPPPKKKVAMFFGLRFL